MSMQPFLADMGLSVYAKVLADEGYDRVEDLADVTLEELVELGLKKGFAKRIIRRYRNEMTAAAQEEKQNDFGHGQTVVVHRGPKKKVSLLLFGETGVGKSTLLQSLGDFIDRTAYGQHNRTERLAGAGDSQTQESGLLNFNNEEWDVDIIDTPGLGDTRGMSVDESHISNLQAFLANKEFNAVCILIKRGSTRSVALLSYVVNELKANMPKNVASHFIVVLTRAEVAVPDADTTAVIEKLGLPLDNLISVNNIAYEELDTSKFSADSAAVKSACRAQRHNYAQNHENLQALLELAHSMQMYQGNDVMELKMKRDLLREQVALLTMKVNSSAQMKIEFREQQAELSAAENDIEKARRAIRKSDTYFEDEPYKLSGKITTHCNLCTKACHIDCGLSYGDNLTSCCAMNGNTCGQCGHPTGRHTHLGWGVNRVRKTRVVEDEHKKREMLSAQSVAEEVAKRQAELQYDLGQLEVEQDAAINEIRSVYSELEKIAILGYNDSYEKYMLENKRSVEQDESLTAAQKLEKLGIFNKALQKIKVFKDALVSAGCAIFGQ